MGDTKPFSCNYSGCGQAFTNEDHLTVHIQKHRLKLNIAGISTSPQLLAAFSDQTPTPTKFFDADEDLLFEEVGGPAQQDIESPSGKSGPNEESADSISSARDAASMLLEVAASMKRKASCVNPFDQQFQKAISTMKKTVSTKANQSDIKKCMKDRIIESHKNQMSKIRSKQLSSKSAILHPTKPQVPAKTFSRIEQTSGLIIPTSCKYKQSETEPIACASEFPQQLNLQQIEQQKQFNQQKLKCVLDEEDREDEMLELKERLLKRNREAAIKSRKKRKNWMTQLENNCASLTTEKEKLQVELNQIKEQLEEARNLLREHIKSGCKVSKVQMLQGRIPKELLINDDEKEEMVIETEGGQQKILVVQQQQQLVKQQHIGLQRQQQHQSHIILQQLDQDPQLLLLESKSPQVLTSLNSYQPAHNLGTSLCDVNVRDPGSSSHNFRVIQVLDDGSLCLIP